MTWMGLDSSDSDDDNPDHSANADAFPARLQIVEEKEDVHTDILAPDSRVENEHQTALEAPVRLPQV